MKITEEYPITVPSLAASTGWHPALIRLLMPKADHWSGTTPRWRYERTLPTWRAACIMAPREKMPTIKAVADLLPGDLEAVIGWLDSVEAGHDLRRTFAKEYWQIQAGRERDWVKARIVHLGGEVRK